MSLELGPEERVLFEGRPRSGPPLSELAPLLSQWVVLSAVVMWFGIQKGSLLPTGIAGPFVRRPQDVYVPLLLIALPAVWLLLRRAMWDAQVYVVTNERFVILGLRKRWQQEWPLTEGVHVHQRLDGDVVLRGLDRTQIPLPGLDTADVDSIRQALEDLGSAEAQRGETGSRA